MYHEKAVLSFRFNFVNLFASLTRGGVEIFLLDDRRQSGAPAYVLDDASPRFASPHFDWLPSMTPSDITSTPVDHSDPPLSGVQPLRWFLVNHLPIPRNRGHHSPSRWKFHVLSRTVGFPSTNQRSSARSNDEQTITTVTRLETDEDLFIDRNDFGVLVQMMFPRTRKRYHAGGTMSRANRARPVLIVVGPKGVVFVAPCLSPSFSLSLSLLLSRGNSSTRGNDDWYALYPPRSIVSAPMKGSQIFFTGLRAKKGWHKKLLFRKFSG